MWEFAIVLLLIGGLVLLAGPWIRNRRGAGGAPGGWQPGTLLVTGVSPRPDAEGRQFVTITGVINGPTVGEHVVYQQMEVDVNDWPRMGDQISVIYSPKNPDNWRLAPPPAPMEPPSATFT